MQSQEEDRAVKNPKQPQQNTKQFQNGTSNQQKKFKYTIFDKKFASQIQILYNKQFELKQIPKLIEQLLSQDIIQNHEGLIGIRIILKKDPGNPPIQTVIDLGIIPELKKWARQNQYLQMKFVAHECISFIASGTHEQCQKLVDDEMIQIFFSLLKEQKQQFVEETLFTLGNMSADSAVNRDIFLEKGCLGILSQLFESATKKPMKDSILWVMTNLCRGDPPPKKEKTIEAFPVFVKVLKNMMVTDRQILGDICWSLSYLSQGEPSVDFDEELLSILVELLDATELYIFMPILRILGNLSLKNEGQVQSILKLNFLEKSIRFLQHKNKNVRQQNTWLISNMVAEATEFLDNEILVKEFLNLLKTDSELVKMEILWVFSNLTAQQNFKKIYEFFLENELIGIYIKELEEAKLEQCVCSVLSALTNIFKNGQKYKMEGVNMYISDFVERGGMQKVYTLKEQQSDITQGPINSILEYLQKN